MILRVTQEEEAEARAFCADCNWKPSCVECPHLEFPQGKWHKKPLWSSKDCAEWKLYLPNFHRRIYERIKRKVFILLRKKLEESGIYGL